MWRDAVRIELPPHDAGTDGGTTYAAADDALAPHVPISRITGFPFVRNGQVAPIGTFTFTRLQ